MILLLVSPSVYYQNVDILNNQTSCSIKAGSEWILVYFKIKCVLFRTILPFLLIVISSIIITLKMRNRRFSINQNNPYSNNNIEFSKTLILTGFFWLFFHYLQCWLNSIF